MSICAPRRVTRFRHRVADHAASGALRDLLEHHRFSYAPEPLSEGAVFGLAGALDLRVRTAAHAVPVIDLEGRCQSLETELCVHLGLHGDVCRTDDESAGWDLLRAELDAGQPTLVRADLRELDYRDVTRHDTRHAVVVTGYDLDADVAWIADGNFPEPQRCSLTSLSRARASGWGAEPVRHAMLRLLPSAGLADPRDAVTAALRRTVRTMRGDARPAFPNVHSGLAGADAIADTWPLLPGLAGDRLGETLAAIRFRIRDAGTRGALYRSLQARFLHDAAALLGSDRLGRAALICDDLADTWRAIASATEGEDAELAHRVAAPWVRRARSLEHAHVEVLAGHLDAA
ncbi:MAG: hypothetical protein QOG15_1488 [Solirubrobacteraceae bacterium]|nr:hypothetical protein [Solirubrobacteraceae bacterium]